MGFEAGASGAVDAFNRGMELLDAGNTLDAITAFDEAVSGGLAAAAVYNNRANAHWLEGNFDAALENYLTASWLEPDSPEILTHLGIIFMDIRQLSAAAACFERAISLAPEHPSARWNRALLLLMKGDFERGWEEYEWRWRLPRVASLRKKLSLPRWRGEADVGKKLLILVEQGFGDTIQFVRFIPEIYKRGLKPTLYCQPELSDLLARVPQFGQIVPTTGKAPAADYYIDLLSLPWALSVGSNVATSGPYLEPDPRLVQRWASKLSQIRGVKVGLVWAGAPRHEDVIASRLDRRRSLKLTQLEPILRQSGCTFISLQKGENASDAGSVDVPLLNFGPGLRDFSDTAALVANLDLVISVDTSVAHLCGAIDCPVWILSRFDGCWRWQHDSDTSAWYRSVKLYRQHTPNDWSIPVMLVANDLERWLSCK